MSPTNALPVFTPTRTATEGSPAATRCSSRRGDFDELRGRRDGAARVVGLRDRRAEKSHHGVADELVERAALLEDRVGREREDALEESRDLLGIHRLGRRREADDVREEDRDLPRSHALDTLRPSRHDLVDDARRVVARQALADTLLALDAALEASALDRDGREVPEGGQEVEVVGRERARPERRCRRGVRRSRVAVPEAARTSPIGSAGCGWTARPRSGRPRAHPT